MTGADAGDSKRVELFVQLGPMYIFGALSLIRPDESLRRAPSMSGSAFRGPWLSSPPSGGGLGREDALAVGAMQEAVQPAVGAGLRHAVQIEPGIDLLAAP